MTHLHDTQVSAPPQAPPAAPDSSDPSYRFIHDDLVVLTAWLAEAGASAKTVADAVEKPWKWYGDLALAWAVLHHEHSHPHPEPLHNCQPSASVPNTWVCGPEWVNGQETTCDWTFTAPEGYELFV